MRDSTDKKTDRKEYLIYALSQIDDDTVWTETEQELSGHIDDREEYFKDCGYDEETAERMAVERMGSPEAAADGFSKVHKNKKSTGFTILSVPLSICFFYFFWAFNAVLFLEHQTMGPGIEEALSLLFIIVLSVIGKRRNSRFICLVAVLNFLSTYGLSILLSLIDITGSLLCSHIVFKLTALLTFDFDALNSFWIFEGVTVAPYLTVLSLLFYAVIFISLVLVFVSVCILKKPTYSLKKRQFTKRIFKAQKIVSIFIILSMLVLPNFNAYNKDNGMTLKIPEDYHTLIIAQSDTPCSLGEIPPEDILIVVFSDRIGANIRHFNDGTQDAQAEKRLQNIAVSNAEKDSYINIHGDYIEKACGSKLKYSVFKTDVPLNLTKTYVYIEFIDYNADTAKNVSLSDSNAYKLVSDSPENWYKVDSADKITAAIDDYNQVEITVSKAE